MQRADQFLVDRRAVEHECVEILDHRQFGGAHPVADRGGIAMAADIAGGCNKFAERNSLEHRFHS
jgi:hypothetical protein